MDDRWIQALWGSPDCDFIQKEKVGNSGGQLLIWDTGCFEAGCIIRMECVIGVQGKWVDSQRSMYVVNVYGPHEDVKKVALWNSLTNALDNGSDEAWVLCGDFNEVRVPEDRFNCDFIGYRARRFNEFISDNRLIEIPLGGRNFTRVSEDGIKYSKLDRFLVTDSFVQLWGDLTALVMDRKHSDHCLIMLSDGERNFGPKPFKVFDAWFKDEESVKVVHDAWETQVPINNRKDCMFQNKLKNVKFALKDWSNSKFYKLDEEIEVLKKKALDIELKAETSTLNEVELEDWRESRKRWLEKDKFKNDMLKQKEESQ
ncbi:uncharacterized protein [Rutidosis leptorrhynchoides]|uniref:uncharacterized protein n=1 Tax=Rutidosis leptorrhynchoides TaxID=125765 RepID=UPI003A99A1EF